jgi:hypothetical protein
MGNMCYAREFELVLLVGLTELKAQISWIDSTTVSFRRALFSLISDHFGDIFI